MQHSPNIRWRAWTGVVGALLLWAFFDATKHSPVLVPFAPFDVDPYDVVGSFTFQIAIAVALLNLVRLALIGWSGVTGRVRYVQRGITVVGACVAATVVSDTIAILQAGVHGPRSSAEAAIWVGLVVLGVVSMALMKPVPVGLTGPSLANRAAEFDWLFQRRVFHAVDPQRHAVRFAVALALGAGVLATAAEIVLDGPAPTLRQTILVVVVRVTIEASVVCIGSLLIGRYLGLVGFPERDTA